MKKLRAAPVGRPFFCARFAHSETKKAGQRRFTGETLKIGGA
jgi:hypothetical protein